MNDHSSAIKFYNEALKESYNNWQKCEILAAIADEYETAGEFESAEEYWDRCCEIEEPSRYSPRLFIAEKGDFLYRRGRFKKAIATYDNALKSLDGEIIDTSGLKLYARTAHFIIDSYCMLGEDIQKEIYHDELENRTNRYIQGELPRVDELKARDLVETAWELYEDDGLIDEALIIMDCALKIKLNHPADYFNRKAILLEKKCRYDEALRYYDRALYSDESNETFLSNKAGCIRQKLKRKLLFKRIEPRDLDLINKALKMLPKGFDNRPYLSTKAEILKELGDPVRASICNAIARKDYDSVDKAERQLKKLKPSESYISIAGTQFYRNFTPFREGTVVNLIKEPDNPHDRHAIRVEIGGETVGYVANSKYMLIKEVKSATDLICQIQAGGSGVHPA